MGKAKKEDNRRLLHQKMIHHVLRMKDILGDIESVLDRGHPGEAPIPDEMCVSLVAGEHLPHLLSHLGEFSAEMKKQIEKNVGGALDDNYSRPTARKVSRKNGGKR